MKTRQVMMEPQEPQQPLIEVPKRRRHHRIAAPQDQLLQATAMMAKRLFENKTEEEIADEFNVRRSTVSRRLKLARQQGVPEEARNIFIREMLPAAMAVVMDALRSSDEKIRTTSAWKLIEGLEALKPPDDLEKKRIGKGDEEYEVWRERIKVTRRAVDSARADRSSRESSIIDAVPVQTADPAPDAGSDSLGLVPISLRETPPDRS